MFYAVIFCGLLCMLNVLHAIKPDERLILEKLYQETDGDNWLVTWDLQSDLCGQFGVICSGSSVIELDMQGNNMRGTLPTDLGDLVLLRKLIISFNTITGTIPTEFGKPPRLQTIDLKCQLISGTIPSELGNLALLTHLNLYRNIVSGQIPTELGNLRNLEFLHIHDNNLETTIPTELGNMRSLREIWMYGSTVNGTIPTELGNMADIELLHLHTLGLSGTIPTELGNLMALRSLWLFRNVLTGTIPTELGNLASLENFRTDTNFLDGNIPPELGNLKSITTMRMAPNFFECPYYDYSWVDDNDYLELPPCEVPDPQDPSYLMYIIGISSGVVVACMLASIVCYKKGRCAKICGGKEGKIVTEHSEALIPHPPEVYYSIDSGKLAFIIGNGNVGATKVVCHRDAHAMEDILRQKGFEVIIFQDLSGDEILKTLHSISQLKNVSCLVFYFSGHGNEGVIYGDDGSQDEVEMAAIIELFQPNVNVNFAGIPKVFLWDCCRGQNSDITTKTREVTLNAGSAPVSETTDCEFKVQESDKRFRQELLSKMVHHESDTKSEIEDVIPAAQYADFLCGYATAETFKAYTGSRIRTGGLSVWTYFLKKHLSNEHEYHFVDLLTFVQNDVSTFAAENQKKRQAANNVNFLTKFLRL